MNKHYSIQHKNEFIQKNNALESARIQLKKEFIGIDNVIDQVIDLSRAWYLVPELQTNPIIINLWGLTGVGKTSLINRFSELIGFEKRLIPFDMGQVGERWTFQRDLVNLIKVNDNKPMIFMFDEFQHAKIINEFNVEVYRPATRIIWELIDSGKLRILDIENKSWLIGQAIRWLKAAVNSGVKVKNGNIIKGVRIYLEILNENRRFKKEASIPFVPDQTKNILCELLPEKFMNGDDVSSVFATLNEMECITLLTQLYEEILKPKLYDCSKSLMFVLGNLDEAYPMAKDLSVDVSADFYYEKTSRITITEIKAALQRRFRSEQIARLGNNHIIYPSFSSESFKLLIQSSLDKITKNFIIQSGIKSVFDATIQELIYAEGVYPTQGVRPLFSTIKNLIETLLPKILTNILLNDISCESIHLSYSGGLIKVTLLKGEKEIRHFFEKVELTLEKIRKPKQNDNQAITAVHESGHAVVYISLFGKLPEQVVSQTADANTGGFIQTKNNKRFLTKTDITNSIAVCLAGYAAEVMIYGKNNLTTGADDDFKKATYLACNMVKNWGMGSNIGAQHVHSVETNGFIHTDKDVNNEVKSILNECLKLVNKTLQKEYRLLLHLADYLSDNRMIEKTKISEMVEQYALDYIDAEAKCQTNYFRNHLKEKVSELTQLKLETA